MAKHKSEAKDKKKGSQLVIRVDKAERDAFVTLCEKMDTSAAREIRRFMREFVTERSGVDAEPAQAVDSEAVAKTTDVAPPNGGEAAPEPAPAASEGDAVASLASVKPAKATRARS